jgi:hypothetical protein
MPVVPAHALRRLLVTTVACLLLAGTASPAAAAPVAVRFPEGAAHGFLVMRTMDGQDVAAGELVQTPRGDRVESRLTFRYKDGSLYDETIVFMQSKVFTLLSYRAVQRGPAFPEPSEIFFERASGRYKVKIGQEAAEGRVELPPDVYNGMIGMLLKNIAPARTTGGQLLAFTPGPRFLKLVATAEGDDQFFVGAETRKATRYFVKFDLGFATGILAKIMGKDVPNVRYWISSAAAPGFLKFEGAMFVNGPVWRIELTGPRWTK